jgi:hypothetical protein
MQALVSSLQSQYPGALTLQVIQNHATMGIVTVSSSSPHAAAIGAAIVNQGGRLEMRGALGDSSLSAVSQGASQLAAASVGADENVDLGAGEVIPWGVQRILAPQALRAGASQGAVKVCVLSTGIAWDHPDLAGTVTKNYFEVTPLDPTLDLYPGHYAYDDNGVGTAEAGVIAALNNGVGVVGVFPGVSLVNVKVGGNRVEVDSLGNVVVNYDVLESDLANGIWDCIAAGSNVAFIGAFFDQPSDLIHYAIADAVASGMMVTAGVGDEGGSPAPNETWPAIYPEVIAVSSINESGDLSTFSSYGEKVDFSAPGEDILSTGLVDGLTGVGTYAYGSSSNLAACHVAATMALLLANNPTATTNNLIGVRGPLAPTQQGIFGLINALVTVIR